MPHSAPPTSYEPLDVAGVCTLLTRHPGLRERLGGASAGWHVREVGDGNLNLVFIVEGPAGALCVKQALPYVRAAGPSWPMTPQRAFYEHAYYQAVAPHGAGLVPAIYHYDPQRYCIVMEFLSPHIILRRGLIAGHRYPQMASHLGEYVARASFFTSDLAEPFERKMQRMALFAGNEALVRISVDLIFTDPYCDSPRNRHTSPQLDLLATELRADAALKVAAARFGQKFLADAQALLHGDLHSGSVMVTDTDSRVIDPEFAFYGPIGFDLGAFMGNLLLSWYSQPGHATRADDRSAYRDWILQQARTFWESFHHRFLALWSEHGDGDAFARRMFSGAHDPAALREARERFMSDLFADMLGFAACKMIRRILGFAHVSDFESIVEPALRARCEAAALSMARRLLTQPQRFRSIDDVINDVRD
ncbi:MAG TPA: S-methyl-5-thioribose kinase [Steroidobacteraceae bacterium]|nr:S-methyl-5-thioribose kinase [Steroidobacteraceae bacterium]